MPVSKKVLRFLDKKKIRYRLIEHRIVYTAFDKAQTLKVKEGTIGKCLVIKGNGKKYLVLLPASKNLNKTKLKKAINKWRKKQNKKAVKKIELVSERWIKNNLKGVKVGAIPPFSDLWDLPLFIERSIMKQKKIIVSAGDYSFSFELSPKQLEKQELKPIKASFSQPRAKKKKKKK